MASAPAPGYSLRDALYTFAPGVLPTEAIDTALAAQYQTNGFTPLTSAQVLAITGTPPIRPTTLPRFADSNPASDGWSIEQKPVGGTLA